MIIKKRFYLAIFIVSILTAFNSFGEKIVGLVAVHNEAAFVRQCLLALAVYTDAIVVLDDASTDNTLEIIKKVAKECNVEKIIEKKIWKRDERGDKEALLIAGREIKGTHFIMIDADEMFAATCAKENWLRNSILALKRGQSMCFPMMNVWDSTQYYRDDEEFNPTQKRWHAVCSAFCDDGQASFNTNLVGGPSGTVHVYRIPRDLKCDDPHNKIVIQDLNHGLLHYKYVNLQELKIKKVWYMCLEYIYANKNARSEKERIQNAKKINYFYTVEFKELSTNNEKIKLTKVPKAWYKYPFFDPSQYKHLHELRKNEIVSWFNKHGLKYFKPLNIWNEAWIKELLANV